MTQDRNLDSSHRELTEELKMLMRSGYWGYIDPDNQQKILSMISEFQGQYLAPSSDCIA